MPAHYDNSNLYSGAELLLLRWLELHSQAERIVNPETELRDCVVFSQVIKAYIKSSSIDKMLAL